MGEKAQANKMIDDEASLAETTGVLLAEARTAADSKKDAYGSDCGACNARRGRIFADSCAAYGDNNHNNSDRRSV